MAALPNSITPIIHLNPAADARVRANLALVLGLKGRFPEAEALLRQDLPPAEAEASLASLRGLVAQPNRWKAIEAADRAAAKPAVKPAATSAATSAAALAAAADPRG